jgi:hypothetical protein
MNVKNILSYILYMDEIIIALLLVFLIYYNFIIKGHNQHIVINPNYNNIKCVKTKIL